MCSEGTQPGRTLTRLEVGMSLKRSNLLSLPSDSCVLALRSAANCPKCGHNEAYFMQLQIRSADEPMTTFFKVLLGNVANTVRASVVGPC